MANPGFDGKYEPRAKQEDNPYGERGDKKEDVIKNVRESTLAYLFHLKRIDECQFRAGDWYRCRWETIQRGSGPKAVDPSNEPVDCSGRSDPMSVRALEAGKDLALASESVDPGGWRVIEMVCGRNMTLKAAGGGLTDWQQRKMSRVLKDALDELAEYLGYAS